MPIYEYECSSCRYYAEVMQKITEAPLRKCPSCGKNTFKKLISAPVFRLKGSGWYETDFKSDQERKRNIAGSEREEPKKEAVPEAKADSKSEAKADSKAEAKAASDGASKPSAEAQGGTSKSTAKKSASPPRSKRPPPKRAAVKRPAAKASAGRRGRR
ncbi:MAG: FmdB family zinc ribbon protein [Steroidobacterales bacterium]